MNPFEPLGTAVNRAAGVETSAEESRPVCRLAIRQPFRLTRFPTFSIARGNVRWVRFSRQIGGLAKVDSASSMSRMSSRFSGLSLVGWR
jgi:hypothetical protein